MKSVKLIQKWWQTVFVVDWSSYKFLFIYQKYVNKYKTSLKMSFSSWEKYTFAKLYKNNKNIQIHILAEISCFSENINTPITFHAALHSIKLNILNINSTKFTFIVPLI